MYPSEFEYFSPRTVDEVLRLADPSRIAGQDDELSATIGELRALMTGLARDRKSIGASIDGVSRLVGATSSLLKEVKVPLVRSTDQLVTVADMFAKSRENLRKAIPAFGVIFESLGRTTSYESALNVYVCSLSIAIGADSRGINPAGNNGFNVEHLRNFNNAGPRVAFGFESQPGHGASDRRGEYSLRRNNIGGVRFDSVGGTTFGGTGVYAAQVGGVWDALLGEGRNWWFFASSDWHNRGSFAPDDRRTTQDFYPGEYQRDFVMVRHGGDTKLRPQAIVDGLRKLTVEMSTDPAHPVRVKVEEGATLVRVGTAIVGARKYKSEVEA